MNDNAKPVTRLTSDTPLNVAIQAWEIFLDDKGRSPYTIKAFIGDLNLFAGFLPPDQAIGGIHTNDINLFLDWLQNGRGTSCSPKTLARRITSVKSFFRWLQGAGVILADPSEKVVQHSVISPLPLVLTHEEEAKVIEAAQAYRSDSPADARPFTLLSLLLLTGIKKGECREININHLDLDSPAGAALYIRYANPAYRYKERRLELNAEWVEAYQEYLAQYQPDEKLFPWSPRRLEYLLEDIGKRAGIEKHLSFDMCRWTAVLRDWENGTDPEQIRIKLGVSAIQFRELKMKLQRLASAS
ncbi:MAG: site-specific integrase [Anaerolineae bacterium]|nr:site-specific integrase [Anaerolineae bacterium]